MRNSFLSIFFLGVFSVLVTFTGAAFISAQSTTPLPPETSTGATPADAVAPEIPQLPFMPTYAPAENPSRVRIPSIRLDAPIQKVGVTHNGEMDVPAASSPNVGWYAKGTVPGEMGSAVFDAHVYAVFKKLRYVRPGDHIYVQTESGKELHFRVEDSRVYKLSEVSTDELFNRNDARRLNLITCAGKFIPRLGTYDHRLIVHAILQDE